MEWHISPIARKSFLSGQEFEKDDRVASTLVKLGDGELARVDLLSSEAAGAALPGTPLCTWTAVFKPKPDDGKEEEEALKLTADNLFISLFEGEAEGEFSEENAELKHFLGLMLERRRVLKVKARTRKYTRYFHRPSKRDFLVPKVALEPGFFLENEEKLSLLLEGTGAVEAEQAASSSPPKDEDAD